MGGPKRGAGRNIDVPNIDVIGGVSKGLEDVRKGIEGTHEVTGDLTPEAQLRMKKQREIDNRAKDMGFASEADRVSQVSKIIDAFGKVRKGKLPAALSNLGPKTGYGGPVQGIMTKVK